MMEGDPSTTLGMTAKRFLRYGRNDGFIDGTKTILETILYTMLSAPCYPGLGDFRRKKHGNLCSPPHTSQHKAGLKRERWDKARDESLDAAAIKISVAFYKELRSNLLYQ